MTNARPIAVLAEDEPLLRMNAAEILRDFGYEVLEAEHADIALQYLEAQDNVVLLFTDVQMPGSDRDGFALAHEVARRWPPVAIIVCSGCVPPKPDAMPERAHFISKPCADQLVHQALDKLRMLN